MTIEFDKEREGIMRMVYNPRERQWVVKMWDDEFQFEKEKWWFIANVLIYTTSLKLINNYISDR